MISLQARAKIYRLIREFFYARGVTEVETPLICPHAITDIHIESIPANGGFLQTSPEYCMKRLLCQGSGPIYQICKAFRKEEAGSNHNPEFTMLEWYRPGFNHHDLMNELDELMQTLLGCPTSSRQSYRDCFIKHTYIDPLTCDTQTLINLITSQKLNYHLDNYDKDLALQIIMSDIIEPQIGIEAPFFIFDFPASQAALAKIRNDDPPVAERFELYYKGFELANGFHELTDAKEQEQRFKRDQEKRRQRKQFVPEIDYKFIKALEHGMPESSGVAVGLDRIIMIATNAASIHDVINP